jgi:hypothetical protein
MNHILPEGLNISDIHTILIEKPYLLPTTAAGKIHILMELMRAEEEYHNSLPWYRRIFNKRLFTEEDIITLLQTKVK